MFPCELDNLYRQKMQADDPRPLYLLLQEVFADYLELAADGSSFPSERELSEQWAVNRRTVHKALEPFCQENKLVRRKNETYVRKSAPSVHAAHQPPRPGMGDRHLKLLLDENNPFQKLFWEEVVAAFHKRFESIHVDLHYWTAPAGTYEQCNNAYCNEIQHGGYDLAHLPPSYRWTPELTAALVQGGARRTYLESDDFICGEIGRTVPELLQCAIPFAFNFQVHEWSAEYADSVRNMTFDEALNWAGEHVPETTSLMRSYGDIAFDLGIPCQFTPEIIRAQCTTILDRLDRLKGRQNVFANDRFEYPSGEVFCQTSFVFVNKWRAKAVTTLLKPQDNVQYWGGFSTLGILRSSEVMHYARLFIEFMLSGAVQNYIWERLRMIPVRRSSLKSVSVAPEKDLTEFLSHCRENPRSYPPPVVCAMVNYFDEYRAGTFSREKMLDYVLRFYDSE